MAVIYNYVHIYWTTKIDNPTANITLSREAEELVTYRIVTDAIT